MTIYELEDFLVSECTNWPGEFVTRVEYKYSGESELHIANEVFSLDEEDSKIVWFSDWYEGQEDIELVAFYRIDYLVDIIRRCQ